MRGAAGEARKIEDSVSKTNKDSRELAALEQRRVQMLGNLATSEQIAAAKRSELNEATAQGVNLSSKEVDNLVEIARLEDLAKKSAGRVSALGDAATATERYAAQVDALKVKLADTTITQNEFNRAVSQLNPTVMLVKDAVSEVGTGIAQAFIQGKSAIEAMGSALSAVGSKASGNVINKLLTGLTGGGFDLSSIGGNLAIAGVSFFASKLFGDPAEKQRQQQAAEAARQAMEQANQALMSVTESFKAFTAAASGPVTSAIKDAQRQFEALKQSAQAAANAARIVVNTPGNTPAAMAAANQSMAFAAQAVEDANRQLAEFNRRTIEAGRVALRGADSMTSIAKAIDDLNKQAQDLQEAMVATGTSASDAARTVNEDLVVALDRLRTQVIGDITRQINQASGRGFINDLNDLFATIADAQRLNIDPGLLNQFMTAQAQQIVTNSQLVGSAFEDLLNTFPQLRGAVVQFGATADEVAKRAASLSDRLFAALNDTSTLEGQLAAFDRQAQQQREQELLLGGGNIVLLEETLMAERLNIIKEFEQKAIEAEKAAAEQRQNAINAAAKNIAEYLNGLLAGQQSTLSPQQRLAQAQTTYMNQLALAQSGNVDAQANITKYAEDLRVAARDFYASGQQYQDIFNQILADLAALPAAQATTDPVVQALLNSILPAIQGTTTAVGGTTTAVTGTTTAVDGTTSAVNTNTTTTSNVSSAEQNLLNTINSSTQAVNSQVQATNSLASAANSLQSAANSLLNSIQSLLDQIRQLNDTSSQQLALLNTQLQQTPATFNAGFAGTVTANNKLLEGMNKVALNTALIVANTGAIAVNTAANSTHGALSTAGTFQGIGAYQLGGWVKRMASGGSVGTDTVPAMLTPGEFVVRNAVAQANSAWLPTFNATGRQPANDNAHFDRLAQRFERAMVGATMAEIDTQKTSIAVLSAQIERLTKAVAANKPVPSPRGTRTVSAGNSGNR
jgi:hypothetical protein